MNKPMHLLLRGLGVLASSPAGLLVFSVVLIACRGSEPMRGDMVFTVKPAFKITKFSQGNPTLYCDKTDENKIIIANYGGTGGALMVDLKDGSTEVPNFITPLREPSYFFTKDEPDKKKGLESYFVAEEVRANRSMGSDPHGWWKLEFLGTWRDRSEWWTTGSQGIVTPPTGIRRVRSAYFDGALVLSLNGQVVMRQNVRNFNEAYDFKFQCAPSRGIVFFMEEDRLRAIQTWTLVKVPPALRAPNP